MQQFHSILKPLQVNFSVFMRASHFTRIMYATTPQENTHSRFSLILCWFIDNIQFNKLKKTTRLKFWMKSRMPQFHSVWHPYRWITNKYSIQHSREFDQYFFSLEHLKNKQLSDCTKSTIQQASYSMISWNCSLIFSFG